MLFSNALRNMRPKDKFIPSWTTGPDVLSLLNSQTVAGQTVTPESSKSIATAYRAANIISDDVASMPFQTFLSRRSGEIQRVRPDPLTRNVAYLNEVAPNRWMSPFLYKKAAVLWLLFWGNAYLWTPPTNPRERYLLPANITEPVFDAETGELWYKTYFTTDPAKPEYIPAVEVLHLMINSTDGYVGKSVVSYAKETFGRQLGAYDTQNRFYGQGLNPAGIVWVDGEANKEMREKIRSAYTESFGGSSNAHQLAVFDRTFTKFEPITMKPVDMQFLESINATDVEIANFFGVPLHKLNMGKQSYESNEQQDLDYLKSSLNSYLVQWEQGAAVKWLSVREQGYTYFRFERSAILSTDAKTRGEYLNGAVQNGRMTLNEARQIEDRPSFDDPAADQLYMQSGTVPIGTLMPDGGTNEQTA